jgi:hypothetical protein
MNDRSPPSLMDRIAAITVAHYEKDRRENPHRFTCSPDGLGTADLFVENVARMVGCNVDFIRRISRQSLPASRVGQRLIYARADVEAYIRAQRETGNSRQVGTRKLQHVAKTSHSQGDMGSALGDFDPVAFVTDRRKATKL